jgi:hypothetical protein
MPLDKARPRQIKTSKSKSETTRGKRVGTKCKGGLAGDRPAWRRWQGDAAPEIRIDLLKCDQVRYDGCMDIEAVRGAVPEMIKGPK